MAKTNIRKPASGRAKKVRSAGPRRGTKQTNPPVRATGAEDRALREHLVNLLKGGQAHARFEETVADFPADLRSSKANGLPYSAWQLLEHLRIAQWDILEFSRKATHVSPRWPEGYWPESEAPPDAEAWDKSVAAFKRDFAAMRRLVADPRRNLFARIPHGDGQTILREALLVADHNAYHLGQLVLLRKLLGAWRG